MQLSSIHDERDDAHELKEAKQALRGAEAGESDEADALETVLAHVGTFGRYQKLLFVLMMPFGLFFAFVYFVQMFITVTPQEHWCHVPELQHLPLELRRSLSTPRVGDAWERCASYAANWSRVLETLQPPPPDTPLQPCQHGWDFLLHDIPYVTVVTERGWVCEHASNVPLAQAVFFGGAIVGGVLFGWMADRFGRVPALMGSNLIGCVGGVCTVWTAGWWDFAFCRFLVGLAFDNGFMMMYILVLEYVGAAQRTWVANMSIALYFGGGCVALPWLALWLSDWRRLLLVTSLPMLLVLAAPPLVPESVRWLLTRGRLDAALRVLRKFQRVNRTHIPEDALRDFVAASRRGAGGAAEDASAWRSAPLRTAAALMVFVFMATAIVFDGLVRMSENLGLDFFVTFTLTSATEIPSVTLLALVMDRWGRRSLTCAPLAAAAAFVLAAACAPRGWYRTAPCIAARFFINMSYNAVIQWGAELLPTGVRALGSSALHTSGFVATALSPFVVYSERVWGPLPLALLCALAAAAAGAALLLPETSGRRMPQTVAEAEALVREGSLCLYSKVSRDEEEKAPRSHTAASC